uniref:Gamma-glutamyl carboxylase n=1 Tax=Apis cerana TaxID=7461 RepID=V9II88_APICE
MHLDNYITKNFTNVTLTVLEGEVTYSDERRKHDITVAKGSSIPIETGQFHKVKTVSAYPACYMYTCTNRNKQQSETNGTTVLEESKEDLPIAKEINYKNRLLDKSVSSHCECIFLTWYTTCPWFEGAISN